MILFVALLAGLQAPNLDVEAGYQGSVFPDSWTRISAAVTYEGAPAQVELRITVRGILLEPVIYRRSLQLSRKTRMRLDNDVFLSGTENEVEVELVGGGKRLQIKSVRLTFLRGEGHRLLAVGALPSYLLEGLDETPSVVVARTSADLLPSSVLPLRCLDTIVIPSALQLDPGQEDALGSWVAQGGRLIFGAGPSTQLRQNPFWRDRCPMVDPEIVTLSVRSKEKEVPVVLVRGNLRRGREMLPLGGAPAAIRAREGWGQIVFLAPLPDQPNLEQVLPGASVLAELLELTVRRKEDLTPSGQPKPPRVHDVHDALRNAIHDPSPVRGTAVGLGIVAGIGYVLLIGPFEYLRLRRRGRLHKGWISFGALVVLFAGLILFWSGAFSFRAPKLVHLTLWDEGRIQTFAALRTWVGREYAVEAPGVLAPMAPAMFFGTAVPPVPMTVDLPAQLRFAAPPVSTRYLIGVPAVDSGSGTMTAAWLGPERKAISVNNATRMALKECWIVSKDTVWRVDAIPAQAIRSFDLIGGESFPIWSRRILAPSRIGNWMRAPPIWERVDPEKFGLVLTFFGALLDAWKEDEDLHYLSDRGLDLSHALARGDTILIGSFDQDLSGLRTDPEIKADTYGWARIPIREAKP